MNISLTSEDAELICGLIEDEIDRIETLINENMDFEAGCPYEGYEQDVLDLKEEKLTYEKLLDRIKEE